MYSETFCLLIALRFLLRGRTSKAAFLIFATAVLHTPILATAASTVASTQVIGTLTPGYMESSYNFWLPALSNPHVQVTYSARAFDARTGKNICGGTIPRGAAFTTAFSSLQDTDIAWHGTGGSWDTPYGHWMAAAAAPNPGCNPGDKISSFGSIAWSGIDFYAPLAVNPPARSIAGLSGLDCTPLNNGRTMSCVASRTGTVNVKFQIAPTYGRFYFHTWAAANTSSNCAGKLASSWFGLGIIPPSEPMRKFSGENWDRGTVAVGDTGYVIEDGWGQNPTEAWTWAATAAPSSSGGNVWTGSNIPEPFSVPIPSKTISCPITVVEPPDKPPGVPEISPVGSCVIGSAYEISLRASDANNQNVRFGIDWNTDGSIDQLVPAVGYVSSASTTVATRTFTNAGSKSLRVLTEDMTGTVSNWVSAAFNCSPPRVAALGSDGDGGGGDANGTIGADAGTREREISAAADMSLKIVPSLVPPGATSRVHWNAFGMTSCTVTAPNGDRWTSTSSPVGGALSSAIQTLTRYTLVCTDGTGQSHIKTAVVGPIPLWQEH